MTEPSAIPKNVFELNVALVVRAVARLAGAVVLTERLGLEGWGRLGWALTIFYVALGDDLGLGAWATRAAARDPDWYRTRATGFFALQLGIAALRYAILLAVLPFVCPVVEVRSLARGLGLAALPSALSTGWLHFARDRTNVLRNASIVREAVWLGGILLLVGRAGDLGRLVPLFVASEVLESAYLFVIALRYEGMPRGPIRLPALREAFAGALPLWLGGRLLHWRAHVGTLVLGWAFGARVVGAFDLAWRVAFNVWSVGAVSLSAMTPTLLRTWGSARDEFRRILRRGLALALALSLPVPVVALFAANAVLVLVLGRDGALVARPLQWLALMVVPAVLRDGLGGALFAQGRTRTIAVLAALDAAFALPAVAAAAAWGRASGLAAALAGAEGILLLVTAAVIAPSLTGRAPEGAT